jgi:hypothetical protein
VSRYELPNELTFSFEAVRVVYLAIAEAEEIEPDGSELRIRLRDCLHLIGQKLAPDLGDLS